MTRSNGSFRFSARSAALFVALSSSCAWVSPALAQSPAVPPKTGDTPATEHDAPDLVVTGTRVIRDGYNAPTPTNVIGAQEIANKAASNLADLVNTLPSLAGAATPKATGSFVSSGLIGINAVNLRNLGAGRTLVLLDGQRVGTQSITGLVDINTFPQSLVKRIDVVTGGVSADWGSDAVAGVVNFVLDKDFTGLKGTAQGGVTTYGDDRTYNLQLAAGMKFAEGRGHILLSGEIAHTDGITGIGKRQWYKGDKILLNPTYAATNGQPQLLARSSVGFANATPGGLITSGPLRGTYFGPGGTPTQFNYGSIVSGNFMVGGDWQYADYATTQDIDAEQNRQSIFGRVSYEVSDHAQIYAQGSYNRSTTRSAGTVQFQLGNLTIQPDNAFIPSSIAARVTGPFSFGTLNGDLGPQYAYNTRTSYRGVIGAKGDFDAIGTKWSWDAYAQRSQSDILLSFVTTVTARYQAAIDSVRNPTTGAIVCRTTLTDPTNGCVPFNIFGTGVASAAAINYVNGTTWSRSTLTEDVFAGTLRGDPFSTWAGPVSIATGIEHRSEAVSGTNDPLTTETTKPYFTGNFLASSGSYDVTEGFFEAVVPLAKDTGFAKSLDFNGAVRGTSYSTAGYVTTWKAGLTYAPVEDITFRFTRSRDIRAPNLAEAFQAGQSNTTTFADPFRNNASTLVQVTTRGNLALRPERADTLGFGVVLKPRFLPGFAVSLDYYDIRIKDAIQSVAGVTLVNQCFTGNTVLCSQITRSATGTLINGLTPITNIVVQPVNIAQQIARGLDFEASYRRSVYRGNLTLRVLATRFLKNYTDNGINAPTDTVGQNGTIGANAAATGSGVSSLPKWRYLASIAYDRGPLALSLTARGFSAGAIQTAYIECSSGCPTSTVDHMTIDNNRLPGAIYFDTSVTVKLPHDVQAFLAVDNVANKDPAQTPYGPTLGGAPLPINGGLYDTLGRTFRAGVRFKL